MEEKNPNGEIRKVPFEKEGAYILAGIIILFIVHTLIVLVFKTKRRRAHVTAPVSPALFRS